MKTFILPDLGEGLAESEIIKWHVSVGDKVEVDQVILTVETAKATVAKTKKCNNAKMPPRWWVMCPIRCIK